MNPAQKHLLKTWIAAILWLGLIVGESTNFASAENTGRLLYPLLHFIFGLELVHFPLWHFLIRKSGHFVGYFTLSWLLFRAWRDTFPYPGRNWAIQWARISFFMTALVACLDEWHQSYLPSRTGNLRDVLLDSTAALIAQIVIFLILRRETPELSPRLKVS
ncbi:MAG: VanZ family protein [Terriglobales bacterium]